LVARLIYFGVENSKDIASQVAESAANPGSRAHHRRQERVPLDEAQPTMAANRA
jgi:hypothetical protein